jgi:ABC-2 type transport system ATP-binding protein
VASTELQNGHLLIELRQGNEIGPLVNLIVAVGGQIEEIRRGKASLEEVFLTLMEEDKR